MRETLLLILALGVLAPPVAHYADAAVVPGTVTVDGGTLDIGPYNAKLGPVLLSNGVITGTSGIMSGSTYRVVSGTVSAILGGNAQLSKTNAGTVTLTRQNLYTGGTRVETGTLRLGSDTPGVPGTPGMDANAIVFLGNDRPGVTGERGAGGGTRGTGTNNVLLLNGYDRTLDIRNSGEFYFGSSVIAPWISNFYWDPVNQIWTWEYNLGQGYDTYAGTVMISASNTVDATSTNTITLGGQYVVHKVSVAGIPSTTPTIVKLGDNVTTGSYEIVQVLRQRRNPNVDVVWTNPAGYNLIQFLDLGSHTNTEIWFQGPSPWEVAQENGFIGVGGAVVRIKNGGTLVVTGNDSGTFTNAVYIEPGGALIVGKWLSTQGHLTVNPFYNDGTLEWRRGYGTGYQRYPMSLNITGSGRFVQNSMCTLNFVNSLDFGGGLVVTQGNFFACNGSGFATGTGDVQVLNGCTLGGTGIVASVSIASGAKIAPGGTYIDLWNAEIDPEYSFWVGWGTANETIGPLTVSNLTTSAGSTLEFHVGRVDSEDRSVVDGDMVQVNGDAHIQGTIDVIKTMSPAVGYYTLIRATGAIYDEGLTLGAIPPDTTASLVVEPQRVSLRIDSVMPGTSFWIR